MHDALEQLAELIRRANVSNNSPGSWVAILPSGEATYAGEKFESIDKMLAAVIAMAYRQGPPERIHKSAGGLQQEEVATCCALPGASRTDCMWASGGKTYCRCDCHRK